MDESDSATKINVDESRGSEWFGRQFICVFSGGKKKKTENVVAVW